VSDKRVFSIVITSLLPDIFRKVFMASGDSGIIFPIAAVTSFFSSDNPYKYSNDTPRV
jgi:hypothetical protein